MSTIVSPAAAGLVLVALAAGVSGCITDPETGRLLMPTDPGAFSVEAAATSHLRSPQLVTIINGYSAPMLVPTMSKLVDADLKMVSETAAIMLGRALQAHGIGVAAEAPKTITLRISNLNLSGAPALPVASITLHAQFGDDTASSIAVQNRGFSAPRAVDGAILFALNRLVLDEAFVAYINRAGADPRKPSAPPPTAAASVAAPPGALASDTRFPRPGDTWTYRLHEPARTGGPKQRDFVVRISAASSASVVEQVLIGNIASGEATHGPGRRVLPLEKSFFSPYLLVFNEDAGSLGNFGPLRIDDPVCAVNYHCEATGRVVAHERVTVPAGSFEAVRLEIQQNWQPATTTNSLATAQERGGRLLTVWYAKDTKRAVKYRSRTTFGNLPPMETDFDLELVSYKLQ
jgi:hypothetical protein